MRFARRPRSRENTTVISFKRDMKICVSEEPPTDERRPERKSEEAVEQERSPDGAVTRISELT